jgi:hypothetical protein
LSGAAVPSTTAKSFCSMKLQNFQGKPQKNQVHQILWGTNQKEVKHPTCFLHQHGREHPKSKTLQSHNTEKKKKKQPCSTEEEEEEEMGGY